MKMNNIVGYKLISSALGEATGKVNIKFNGINFGQQLADKNEEDGESINITTIDEESKKYNFNVGFIKMDVEGKGFAVIKGAINTIKKFRPILSLGIYHNREELFKIKPFLEKNLENYVYEFKMLGFDSYNFCELTLFCYPKEIIE